MKRVVQKIVLLVSVFMLFTAAKCSDDRKLSKEVPEDIKQVYYHKWVGGVEGAGTGTNVFVVVKEDGFLLDSIFYQSEQKKLVRANNLTWSANFRDKPLKDITMSGDSKEEYGNELPKVKKQIPFTLENNECVISYIEDNERIYVKISNMIDKGTIAFPSPPNKSDR